MPPANPNQPAPHGTDQQPTASGPPDWQDAVDRFERLTEPTAPIPTALPTVPLRRRHRSRRVLD